MIRRCTEADLDRIFDVVNDASLAYKGVIPDDRWHEPYMPRDEVRSEIREGVVFWGFEEDARLVGVMGIQDRADVTLIRHSYVLTEKQKQGIGTKLLRHLENLTDKPILIGTWADARWAVSFYRKNGYALLPEKQKDHVLRKYWTIPERQVEASVVLANPRWVKACQDIEAAG
jgi:GNAT superfamily N-acetyltransferase